MFAGACKHMLRGHIVRTITSKIYEVVRSSILSINVSIFSKILSKEYSFISNPILTGDVCSVFYYYERKKIIKQKEKNIFPRGMIH